MTQDKQFQENVYTNKNFTLTLLSVKLILTVVHPITITLPEDSYDLHYHIRTFRQQPP